MRVLRNKKVSTVALVLVLTITATLVALPTVNAADVDTYAFLTVAPNPIGVGQTVLVCFWLNSPPPTAVGATGDRWENLTVTIEKPDGTTDIKGPYKSDPVGSQYFQYAPDRAGKYYFQFSFPGQRITGMVTFPVVMPIDNYYKPSTSAKVELTVQDEAIEFYPDWPLPDPGEYWERPIDYENREWYKIAGNWLQASYNGSGGSAYVSDSPTRFNPYTKAPNTAHIVWTKPIAFGGIAGGEFGDIDYYGGETYERKWSPPIIMQGRLYYNTPDPPRYGFTCVDLRTGETIWWQNSTGPLLYDPMMGSTSYPQLTLGQLYDYESPNQHGIIPYLWGISTAADGSVMWSMYDAFTGNWILNLVNASTGRIIMSPEGDMLVHILSPLTNTTYTLSMWNSSRVSGLMTSMGPEAGLWFWRPPLGATLDWRTGIQWTVNVTAVPGLTITRVTPDIVYASTGNFLFGGGPVTDVAYDAKTGEELWIENRPFQPSWHGGPMQNGVYTQYIKEELAWYGYDIYSGKLLWGPTEPRENAWGMYVGYGFVLSEAIAYGKLYSSAYDGYIYAYDLKTGKKMWTFSTGSSGFETVYGIYPFHASTITVADGKLYSETGEHSPTMPLWRGGGLYCVDAETGEQLWKIKGWFIGPAIADGYLVSFNQGDGEIYCFGKGKTATTVTASPKVMANGDTVMIEGTVLDQSPGAKDTPAIADEYMTEWMEYLYMQKPCPMDLNGVPVKLEAFGEDGSYIEIGTVTSDSYGNFKHAWTPPDEELYTVMATFEGSDSYWSSYAATGLSVGPAPEAPPETEAAPDYTPMFAGIIAAIVVVAILVLYTLWTVRKQRK